MTTNLVTFQEMSSIAKAFKESGMFPDLKSEAQAIVKIQAGRELGVEPFAAMQGFDVIQGKPRMGSSLQAALIKRSGKYTFKTLVHTESVCKLEFFEIAGTQLMSLGYSEFTLAEAQQAGIGHKDNWKKHPKNMLFARALSNGAKWYCADVFIMLVYNESDELEAAPYVAMDTTGIDALKAKPDEPEIVVAEIVEPAKAEPVQPMIVDEPPKATAEDVRIITDSITACKSMQELADVREAFKGTFKFTQAQIQIMRKVAETKEKELSNENQ